MFKTIKNAINNTIDATIINAFTILSRYFVTLDPVLNSYYEMVAPITFAGDFEVEVEFSWDNFATNSEDCLLGNSTGTSMIVVKGTNNTTPNAVLFRGEGTLDVVLYNGLTGDNKLQKLKVQYNAPNLTIVINGLSTTETHSSYPIIFDQIGVRGNNLTYFNGIIANAKFTDKSGASDVITTFKLDNSPAAENYTYSTELLDNNTFSDNANARQYLVATKGWIITDGGAA